MLRYMVFYFLTGILVRRDQNLFLKVFAWIFHRNWKKNNLSHPVTSKQPPEFVFSSLIIYGNVLQACHFDQIKKTW